MMLPWLATATQSDRLPAQRSSATPRLAERSVRGDSANAGPLPQRTTTSSARTLRSETSAHHAKRESHATSKVRRGVVVHLHIHRDAPSPTAASSESPDHSCFRPRAAVARRWTRRSLRHGCDRVLAVDHVAARDAKRLPRRRDCFRRSREPADRGRAKSRYLCRSAILLAAAPAPHSARGALALGRMRS